MDLPFYAEFRNSILMNVLIYDASSDIVASNIRSFSRTITKYKIVNLNVIKLSETLC